VGPPRVGGQEEKDRGPASWNGRSLLGGGKAEVEYAIFYTLPSGYTLWDNNDGWNHHILIASRQQVPPPSRKNARWLSGGRFFSLVWVIRDRH
jgi:hypothetical protein